MYLDSVFKNPIKFVLKGVLMLVLSARNLIFSTANT